MWRVRSNLAFRPLSSRFTRPTLLRPPPLRHFSSNARDQRKSDNKKVAYYLGAATVLVFGLSYAAVPLYKVFCQMTGFGGTTQVAEESSAKKISPIENGRILKIYFTASVHDTMPWSFKPTQREVRVVPGETALAFYTVQNTSNHPITGVATYNVHPPKAGLYFNKIQCFCFEEQRLGAYEEVDMPVFFFIDPQFADDPAMDTVNSITLSYTFFKTGDETAEPVVSSKEEKTASAQ
ncbi:cytochrome c oxidase assembly protein [archaeon]|nr:MAG: cytochrome c oxidase assembly protein [archaeon]